LIDITPAGTSFAVATNHTVAEPVKVAPAPLAATATAALIPFKLADIGECIAEVEVLKWFVKVRLHNHLTLDAKDVCLTIALCFTLLNRRET